VESKNLTQYRYVDQTRLTVTRRNVPIESMSSHENDPPSSIEDRMTKPNKLTAYTIEYPVNIKTDLPKCIRECQLLYSLHVFKKKLITFPARLGGLHEFWWDSQHIFIFIVSIC